MISTQLPYTVDGAAPTETEISPATVPLPGLTLVLPREANVRAHLPKSNQTHPVYEHRTPLGDPAPSSNSNNTRLTATVVSSPYQNPTKTFDYLPSSTVPSTAPPNLPHLSAYSIPRTPVCSSSFTYPLHSSPIYENLQNQTFPIHHQYSQQPNFIFTVSDNRVDLNNNNNNNNNNRNNNNNNNQYNNHNNNCESIVCSSTNSLQSNHSDISFRNDLDAPLEDFECGENYEPEIDHHLSSSFLTSCPPGVSSYDHHTVNQHPYGDQTSPLRAPLQRLPPFAALLSSPKPAVIDSSVSNQAMFSDSEASDVSLGSIDGDVHYTNLTNVFAPLHDDQDPSFMDQSHLGLATVSLSLNDPEYFKHEPSESCDARFCNDDLGGTPFTDSYFNETVSTDSDGYESSSYDRSYMPVFPTDGIVAVPHMYDPEADLSFSPGSQSPPSPDEGYIEGELSYYLPDFTTLENRQEQQQQRRRTQYGGGAKDKKKIVHNQFTCVEKERRKPGRKPGQVSNVLHLWEFMRDLLQCSQNHGIIEWISKPEGVFKVMNSTEVARLWGEKKKNKKKMTYEKLSRSLRYSRLEGYFAELPKDKNYPKKLCFKFGPKSKDWH